MAVAREQSHGLRSANVSQEPGLFRDKGLGPGRPLSNIRVGA